MPPTKKSNAAPEPYYHHGLKPEDLRVTTQGEASILSPLREMGGYHFVDDGERVMLVRRMIDYQRTVESGAELASFERAGSREKLYYQPPRVHCGIVTCGGLCPGLNNVVRGIVRVLMLRYGVKQVTGFQFGYSGLGADPPRRPIILTPDVVEDVHRFGGTFLGSCRGAPPVEEMVNTLARMGIDILFVVGGDGTLRGGHAIHEEIQRRGLHISVVGVPKTIDNDLHCVEKSFGFTTSVETAAPIIQGAHEEARGAWNGVGVVKLMGRHSGFIAMHATLANHEVNFCLIPESPFSLHGKHGFLTALRERLQKKHHAVVVVAEGAGQDLMFDPNDADAFDQSGNRKLKDIGPFLVNAINKDCAEHKMPVTVKYIDPSYIIRSVPAGGVDSEMCGSFAQNAVHAAMAGKTDLFIGYHNSRFIHVPILAGVKNRKAVNVGGPDWRRVLDITGQETFMRDEDAEAVEAAEAKEKQAGGEALTKTPSGTKRVKKPTAAAGKR